MAHENTALLGYWNDHYISAAQVAYPSVTKAHDLRVGWKISSVTGMTHNGYYWPTVDGNHDVPVLHEASSWDHKNGGSCPAREGDGLCLIPQEDGAFSACTSGGVQFHRSIGHVLVYPHDLAKWDEPGKVRAPWVVQVDVFEPMVMLLNGFIDSANLGYADLGYADLGYANLGYADLGYANLGSANLRYADLRYADLGSADLGYANLRYADLGYANLGYADLGYANLRYANLGSANLRYADLRSADLRSANLGSADLGSANANQLTLFPTGFDAKAAGVQFS
ncbi:MAG TPA: pentapeptide repeat-containing protein [Acidimicrobiia bacterium]|nr:pentapeptide repeat-containing protein [Acidimicrobiia bacterium]